MAPDKLGINDPRVAHHEVTVRGGRTYHYLHAKSSAGPHKATILLIHGFPDLAMGWRYQVPLLLSLGLQVIVPDQLGYGRTDAPPAVEHYSMRSLSDDLASLLEADFPSEPQVFVGGHDWGGQLAWRFAEWHPAKVRAVFSVCTPYFKPRDAAVDLPQLVEALPSFRYQLQFAGEDVVRFTELGGRTAVRQVLNAMYGGLTSEGKSGFTIEKGLDFELLPRLGPARMLTEEELDFYADEYARHGFRGPTNWYRTRMVNSEGEKELVRRQQQQGGRIKITMPALFVSAKRDAALPPSMAKGMEASFENLTMRSVDANHWALTQTPDEVNAIIGEFLGPMLVKTPKASI